MKVSRAWPVAAALLLLSVQANAGDGSFRGASGHVTKGSVSVSKSGGKLVIQLGSNFSLDRAPDPYVALGNGSRPMKGGIAGKLRSLKGAQSYSIGVTQARSNASHVVLWCKRYGVPLGIARLK